MGSAEEEFSLSALEPIPTSWFDLPFEMREMVIDRMDAKTRCKFAQCSKLCEKEAKKSRNYLYGINVQTFNSYKLQVLFDEKTGAGYTLHFIVNGNGETTIVYETSCVIDGNRKGLRQMFMEIEHGESSEVKSNYFKKYIEQYKNSIKFLHVSGYEMSLVDHHVRDLKHLKEIGVFNLYVDVIECGFLSKNQIMNADIMDAKETNFTFEEIIRLEGSSYHIRSEEFDEECVLKYLKMWKNGELSKNLKSISVNFEPFRVNFQRMVEGLNVFNYVNDGMACDFEFYANHHVKDQIATFVEYHPYFLALHIFNST